MNSRPVIRDNRIVVEHVAAGPSPLGYLIFDWLPVVLLAVLCVGALVFAATFQAAPR